MIKTTYIVRKNTEMLCGNCRMRLPHLLYNCPFCGGIFANHEELLNELFHEHYKAGTLTSQEYSKMLNIEDWEQNGYLT